MPNTTIPYRDPPTNTATVVRCARSAALVLKAMTTSTRICDRIDTVSKSRVSTEYRHGCVTTTLGVYNKTNDDMTNEVINK